MPEFSIRDAVAGDEPALQGVVFAVLAEYGLNPDPEGTDADLKDVQAHYIARGGLFLAVTGADGQIVGCGGLLPVDAQSADVRKMYLLPAARGHGLGGALLRRLIARAREMGCQRVTLETAAQLKQAIVLYKRFGFERQPIPAHLAQRCDQFYALNLEAAAAHRSAVNIGLIGDFNPEITAHRAIPVALQLAAERTGIEVDSQWVDTAEIHSAQEVKLFDGLWCVPGSPYHSTEGALIAIRHAREHSVPFLGTCGGFQHVVLEFARNVLGWRDAEHAESKPQARRAVISALQCPLLETSAEIRLERRTRLSAVYGEDFVTVGYHCSYGLNPRFQNAITGGPLHACAFDSADEIRAVEMEAHPFFIATLFQPERAALEGHCPPPVLSFVKACAA